MVFVYLAGLAFYYGFLKSQNISVDKPIAPVVQYTQPELKYPEARVPPITEITGRNRK
jgi:hypothetical protein